MHDDAKLLEIARRWWEDDPDKETRTQLQELIDSRDMDTLREIFSGRLQFGTAGLRGILGPGTNRMNRALVRKVSLGLARYLLATQPDIKQRGVVVGNDARRLSPELAEDTARVLAGQGIVVHLFQDYAPTPLVAFAVGELNAGAGVVVTASHNPPEYNGYKVYWDNGAQIIPPHDRGISQAIDEVAEMRPVIPIPREKLEQQNLIRPVSPEVAENYLQALTGLLRYPDLPRKTKVVYTPMHGVGEKWVSEILRRTGVESLYPVEEQATPDGDFPTVRFPNPEEEGALDLAIERARRENADLILANDPDVDRLAVAVRTPEDEFRLLSGNEIGSILAYYLLTENLPREIHPLVMTTIVSSRLLKKMATELDAHYDETLTGFKWIANASQKHRKEKGWQLIMGYEEALGYTVGMITPDKDGIGAALLFTEIAALCESRGQTLLDYLEAIYRRFGLFVSKQHSITLPGTEGIEQIGRMMELLRAAPPLHIGSSWKILKVVDYLDSPRGLPSSNVLQFSLDGDAGILVRPSGTEPKIKYYFELSEAIDPDESFQTAHDRAMEMLDELVDSFLDIASTLDSEA